MKELIDQIDLIALPLFFILSSFMY